MAKSSRSRKRKIVKRTMANEGESREKIGSQDLSRVVLTVVKPSGWNWEKGS